MPRPYFRPGQSEDYQIIEWRDLPARLCAYVKNKIIKRIIRPTINHTILCCDLHGDIESAIDNFVAITAWHHLPCIALCYCHHATAIR